MLPIIASSIGQLVVGNPASAATIYRCEQEDAAPLFSQVPCANAQPLEPAIQNRFQLPKLSAAEQQQLAELASEPRRRAERRRTANTKQNERALAHCVDATQRMRQLKSQRRNGYRLSDDKAMNAEEQRLRRILRQYC